MVTYEIDHEDIISDFLRVHLTDPRARAEDTDSNSFTATAGQTEFTLSSTAGSVSCITSVTVDGTSKSKWKDYYWDYQNQKVTFFTALSGSETVIFNFKYGSTNWIYSDRPDEELSATSFPRISCFTVGGSSRRLGQYEAPQESSPVVQIDVWARRDQIFTINGRKYSNQYLARYLGNKISRAFEDNESDLFPLLYNYNMVSMPQDRGYSKEYKSFHVSLDVNVKGLKIGRIEK